MVTIPSILVEPGERADYLVTHYWDNFDFTDTLYIRFPEITEQAFVDYIDIMPYAAPGVVSSSIKSMLKRAEAEKTVYLYLTALYEKYLYDPNSVMRNDEFFIPVLEAMLSSDITDEKTRPAYLLTLAKRNRPGEKATDFAYTLPDGKTSTLYALKSDYTILFFYNPDCQNCKEVSAQLKASLTIRHLLKEGKLSILAVYPDHDLAAWRAYLSDMPGEWINAYDANTKIIDQELYDLKAIPTLYLLDSKKTVLLKDPTFDSLESHTATGRFY
jgi:hypothetical protein